MFDMHTFYHLLAAVHWRLFQLNFILNLSCPARSFHVPSLRPVHCEVQPLGHSRKKNLVAMLHAEWVCWRTAIQFRTAGELSEGAPGRQPMKSSSSFFFTCIRAQTKSLNPSSAQQPRVLACRRAPNEGRTHADTSTDNW